MHISYIETYIIYKLRAREEKTAAGRSNRRWLLKSPDVAGHLVQLVSFPGHVVNDRHFGVTLKRVKNAL